MKIYYSDIRSIDPKLALYPPQSCAPASALGTSLLAAAYGDYAKIRMPQILRKITGRPIFAGGPNLHFSISHSRSHVLCAISETPVGADTLDHRPIRPTTIKALATGAELMHFNFHELWALRESLFKLTNEGNLRTLRFTIENGKIKSEQENTHFRLYSDIENSSTAIASFEDNFPDKLIKVPIEELLKPQSKLD